MTNGSDFSGGNALNGGLLKGSPKNENAVIIYTPFLSFGPKLYELYLLNIEEDILMDIVDGSHYVP